MYEAVANLPPHEDESPIQNQVEPGKRPWETSKTGYISWAVDTLVRKANEKDGQTGSAVGAIVAQTSEIGRAEDIKAALEVLDNDKMDVS